MAKVNANKFMGTDQSGLEKKVAVNSQKITLLKNIIKAHQSNLAEQLKSLSSDGGGGLSSGLDESIKNITNSVTSISETLKDTHKFEKDQAEDDRRDEEISKRGKKENESEKEKFKGLKETATKVLAPIKNMFDVAFGWLKKLFFAKAVLMFFDWFSDEKNTDKVKSVVRFFRDWWPVLLAGYIAFATPFIPFTIMIIGAVKGLVAGIITAIGWMKAAALSMGPWGWAALAVLAGGGAIALHLAGKKRKASQNVDQSLEEIGSEETVKALQKEQEDKNKEGNWFTNFFRGTVMGENAEYDRQQKKVETGEEPVYGFFGRIEKKNMGGMISGSGPNEDSVPTMLTPGEFVMSRGAVEAWGADVLAGMNAAAGGTNESTPMSGYNQGGLVGAIDRFGLPEGLPGLGGGGGGTNAITDKSPYLSTGKKIRNVGNMLALPFRDRTIDRDPRSNFASDQVKQIDDALSALDFMSDKPEVIAGLERIGSSGPQFSPVGGVDRKLGVEPPTRRMAASAMNLATKSPKAQAAGVPMGMSNSGSGNNIPPFSAGSKVSLEKIKVLGMTR